MANVLVAQAASPDPSALVLQYAHQQRQWERGISWLLAIVCVYQLMLIPAPLLLWMESFSRTRSLAFPLSSSVVFSRSTGFGQYWMWLDQVCNFLLLPLTSLLIAISAFFLLQRVQMARRMFFISATVHLAALLIGSLPTVDYGYVRLTGVRFQLSFTGLSMVVATAYPLLLVMLVLLHARDSNRPSGRRTSAAAIWWLTAGACMLYALPTVFLWLSRFTGVWMRTTLQVFGLFTDEGLLTSLSGIGTMCGAAACFSSFLLVLYTVLRGPRARSALLICAALLFVYALVPGVALIRATDDFVYSGFSLHRLWTHHRLSPMLAQIPLLAVSLAFPLAIRMALSLSAVREKLDRQPPPTPPATAEES